MWSVSLGCVADAAAVMVEAGRGRLRGHRRLPYYGPTLRQYVSVKSRSTGDRLRPGIPA